MKVVYTKLVVLLLAALLMQGCEKETENYPKDQISRIEKWYNEQEKSLILDWSKSERLNRNAGKDFYLVPLADGINLGPEKALLSVMMFQIGARGNVDATKLDVVSDITSVTEHYLDIVNSYISKSGHQGAILGNAHVLAYNLNQEYLASTVIEKEACKPIDARFQSKEVGILTTMKQSTNKKFAARDPSIANVPEECRDWYLVEHFSDGSSDWYYMYTVCSSNADGGGSGYGGGGGGGGTGGATYFYESPAEPVDLQEALNCFNSIPSTADTKYKVTIHTHLANPNLPTQVYNFSDGDPGHAYITLEKSSGSTSHSLTFGFYPSTDTWITGTKNAVGSAVGEEVPATRRSDASYTVTVDERTFRNVCNTSTSKGTSQYDLNNYNCTDYAIDVFNAALPSTKPLSVADSPIGFTTPAGLYGRLNQMNSAGVSGVSMNQTNAPVSSSPCN